ncbi:MAG: TorF family putative porin, partial [Pseudoxanthomonas sp.]
MKPVKLSFAVALVLAAMPLASFAQDAEVVVEEEAESPISVSLAATTDYVFRGVSQTDNGPAFQAGLNYSAPFGLYAGVWGSNVDFGEGGPNFEVDYYVGWNKDLSDAWNLDLGVTRYTYESADSGYGDIDSNEYIAKLSWSGPVTIGGILAYADDYANTGAEETYTGLSVGYDVGESGFSVGATTGYTSIKAENDGGRADYFDGSVTV